MSRRVGYHSLSKRRKPRELSGLEMWLHEQARREQHERCRGGFTKLLERYAPAMVYDLEWQEDGPWLLVTLWWLTEDIDRTEEFAIWKVTGNVYRVHDGAVEDEPFILTTPWEANGPTQDGS